MASPCAPVAGADLHTEFDAILRRHVRDGGVDYLALRQRDRRGLAAYLDRLAEVDTTALAKPERLALLINLYNASMLKAIVERLRVGYSTADDGYAVFDEKFVRLDGKTIALNQLENEIIRPTFGEPRIHVALVCGARSCPPLLPRAYRGDDLDAVLADNLRRFVRDPQRNAIDRRAGVLRLSRIFDWYKGDFGGADAIAAYVATVLDEPAVARFSVAFLDYSWELNLTPPAAGRWVSVAAATELRRDADGDGSIASIPARSFAEVVGEQPGWLEIEIADVVRGWVASPATQPFPPR